MSCALPPGVKKHVPDIEGQFLRAGFSGAYVSIADFPLNLFVTSVIAMQASLMKFHGFILQEVVLEIQNYSQLPCWRQ
jgi:hypothetical protein